MMWIEHMTSPLPRECSTTELHGRKILGPKMRTGCCSPTRGAGAGEGNRTLVISLEGFCSTIELHPPDSKKVHPHSPPLPRNPRLPSVEAPDNWWRGLDSNQRRRKANRFTVCPL